MLHVHQEKVDDLGLNAVDHEFVAKNDLRRKSLILTNFGFSEWQGLWRRLTEWFKPISKSLGATTVKQGTFNKMTS